MRYSKYAVLVFLIFSSLAVYAQVITVTSKEDSGPGTLREALTTAANNGTATKDMINFNLPISAVGDNIIRLRSQLPAVTSNVKIDGSTQPGQALGVSGAKIIIEPELPRFSGFSGLVIGTNPYTGTNYINVQTTDVEVYGLYIRKFSTVNNLQNVNTDAQISGIILDYRVDRIKIGAAGKGNVIGGNTYGIFLRNNANSADLFNKQDNISIQGNLIGLTDDGFTDESNYIGINADISYAALTIGGDTRVDANVIAANGTDVFISRIFSTNQPMLLNIFSNKIGTDFSGKKHYKNIPLFSGSSTIQMNGIKIDASNTTANVSKNIISGHLTTGLSIVNSEFLITGNYIGTGIAGTETNMGNGSGIRIEGAATGTIGGAAAMDPNFIGYNGYGIESFSTRGVKITRNSMFCNTNVGIGKVTTATQAYIQVLKISATAISGKANPGAEVELFYTDDCPGSCQGKTYFATERAGVDGRWRYSGPINRKVTATASLTNSLNGVTSQFSTAGLLPNEAIVEPVTCKGLGSVTINEPREGISFNWYKLEADGTAGHIGSTPSKNNLDVGNYEVRIGDGCSEVTHRFPITDQIMTDLIVTTPSPQCGQTVFNFTASIFRGKGNISFVWTNEAGNFVGNGNAVNLPEGTYTVTATDEAGCSKTYTFPKIERRLKPTIKPTGTSGLAQCGKADGYIRGITVGDTQGTVTYIWSFYSYDVNGAGVKGREIKRSTGTADLEDIAGGYYMLEVTDEGGCSPAVPYIKYIGITNSVEIRNGVVVNATCQSPNGAISGINIKDGDTWVLSTPAGVQVRNDTCVPGVPFDISNLAAGTYIMNASNSITQCTAFQRSFNVGATPITEYTIQDPVILKAACDQNNGSIKLTYTGFKRPAENRCEWRNDAGVVMMGTSTELNNLGDGDYTLYITDENGCTSPSLGPFKVGRIELLIVDQLSGSEIHDQCALGRGGVTGVKITGGLPLSGSGDDVVYKYLWKNMSGGIVGTGKDLTNVDAGQYYLEVSDQTESRCGIYKSRIFTIEAPIIPLENPIVNSTRVCYATEIMLPVVGAQEGTYQMFLTEDDARPILETTNGRFIFKVSKTGDYLIRRKLGSCYSGFTPVHIEVTNDNLEIRNTMSPNGDGKNDYWEIKGLPDYAINIKVYTRSGQLVYESTGRYDKPFDGRFRGAELPAGAYYYKIDLKADCKPIAGSITLLR